MIKLNLGSGHLPKKGYINIDNRAEVKPDLVHDVTWGLPFDDNSVDEVRAYDFLEHIPTLKIIPVMDDIWRVLKHDGLFDSYTPSTDGWGAFCDPTHVSYWTPLNFRYFMSDRHRAIYGIKARFTGDIKHFMSTPENNIWHIRAILHAEKNGNDSVHKTPPVHNLPRVGG